MRTRLLASSFVLALAGGGALALSAPAHSDEDAPLPPLPRHSHLHVTGLVLDEETGDPVSIRKCTPLAGGRSLPLQAHHDNLHTGRAGEAQWEAGNAVVPVFTGPAPYFTPWTDCESLMEVFGLD